MLCSSLPPSIPFFLFFFPFLSSSPSYFTIITLPSLPYCSTLLCLSHHITSHHITSYHITSHHITSHHIISHHITLYHIISHHMMSGSMPRCMDVICRNEVVEQAKAGKKTLIYNYHQIIWWNLHISFFTLSGDKIVFTGTLAVIPDSGGLSRVGEATLGGKT